MTPKQKDAVFRVSFAIPTVLLAWFGTFLVDTYDAGILTVTPWMPVAVLLGSLLFACTITFIIIDIPPIKWWREQLTGYTLPEVPKKDDVTSSRHQFAFTLFLLGTVWCTIWINAAPTAQYVFLAIAGAIGLIGIVLLYQHESFDREYGGAVAGWTLGVCIVAFPLSWNYPLVVNAVELAITTFIGHQIGKWWNNLDFVKQTRSKREADEQQKQRELAAREQRRAQAEQEAAQEAALSAKLDEVRRAAAPPPSGRRSSEEDSVADEIRRYWKK